jgi:hypothetical protein
MKAILAKVEKFLDAAKAKLDPPGTHVTWLEPLVEGWTREAAKAQAAEWEASLIATGQARQGDEFICVTWLPSEERPQPEYQWHPGGRHALPLRP